MKIDTAVVLAGGAGTRLGNLTASIPKALIKINEKPLLAWIIEWLSYNYVKNLIIGVAHRKEKIINFFGDGSEYSVNITYSVHTVEGGTAEGFRKAISRYVSKETFFALNGDQITDLRLDDLASYHLKGKPIVTMVGVHPPCPFGYISVTNDRYATHFVEKPKCHNLCSGGIYVFDHSILDYLPERGDVEKTTFPLLASQRKLLMYEYNGFFVTINTQKDLLEAENALKVRMF